MTRRTWLFVISVAAFVIAVDQLTKSIILSSIEYGEIIPVLEGFFNLTLTYNRGVAFGLFAGIQDGWRHLVLGLTTFCALSVVFYLLIRDYADDRIGQFSLSLVLGGALGNILDRARHDGVVDFLDFYFGNYHWPAFNVADSCICIGVILLVIRTFFGKCEKAPGDLQ